MRRLLITTAALAAAVFLFAFLFLVLSLPAPPAETEGSVDPSLRDRTIPGAYHIHSTRSDGSGDADAIAAAASRAGLRFVILTDHGDATRKPDPPAYRHGVLVIDAVEISTTGGHYVALGLPAAPYPLGGEPSAVAEDVARLGGFGIVAHPDSLKPELAWRDSAVPFDGIEWLNLDSEWRDESRGRLARAAFDSFFRPGPSLASILDRPSTLARWDAVAARRPVVALPAHDAHGGAFEGGAGSFLRVPSYEATFRAFSTRAIVTGALSGDAAHDGRLLIDAVRAGRVFSAVDGIASLAFVEFYAYAGDRRATMGESLEAADGVRLAFRSTFVTGGAAVLLRDGVEVAQSSAGSLDEPAVSPGAYRVEVHAPASPGSPPVPWIVTNPIYLRRAGEVAASNQDQIVTTVATFEEAGAVEKDPLSAGSLSEADGRRTLRFQLGPGGRASQYAAVALSVPPGLPPFDTIVFTARSVAPMRVSVQLRFNDRGGLRWTRSVFVSPDPRRIVVPIASLVPPDGVTPAPSSGSASTLLFVVDLTNARPGQSGQLELSNLALSTAAR
jgi:hypothetical protein